MSLKKKSKSLGHLTALGSPSPNFNSPRMKKNISVKSFNMTEAVQGKLKFLQGSGDNNNSVNGEEGEEHKIDKQMQVRTKTTTPKKLKGLVRQKTNPSILTPVAMGKAILAKASHLNGTRPNGKTPAVSSAETLAEVFGSKDAGLIPNKHRAFLMDTQIKYTVGLQCQERNLFLFNDLLLIAKERSSSHFKLKDQVPLSDVWLSTCIGDVSEVTLESTTSFVIGWPISNAAVTFSSSAQKSLWWDKLHELIERERSHVPSSTNVQVTYFDQLTNFEHVKSLYVSVTDTARDCIRLALTALDISESTKPEEYQLWVRTKFDEAPYPLIGHEIPLVIKLHWTRQAFNSRNQKSYDEYKAGCRCSFILRKVGQMANFDAGSQKTKLKKVKSSIKLQNVFRRVSQGSKSTEESSSLSEIKKLGRLFGHRLEDVCSNNTLPQHVCLMLNRILTDGPTTVGIFRRSPNARAMRELRDKLDHDDELVDFKECSVFVVAALLKDFLRSMPDCLLMCERYSAWIQKAEVFAEDKDISGLKSYVTSLPRLHLIFLQHLLYVLNNIASRSQENMMTSSNLAICVGPSVLWSSDSSVMMDQNYSKDVSKIAQILIDEYFHLFGDAVPYVFCSSGNGSPEESGRAAVSGGMVSAHAQIPAIARKVSKTKHLPAYDNSSLDSLLEGGTFPENDLSAGTTEASLTNLSHDSGLTTSDSQLYAFEESNSLSSDEFCVENGAPSGKAFVKRFIHNHHHHHHHHSLQQPSLHPQKNHDELLPGQVPEPATPAATPHNHQNVYRRVYRHDDVYSNRYEITSSESEEQRSLLRRTASEESVTRSNSTKTPSARKTRRPAAHRKGRAPAPPKGHQSGIVRSNSVNQVRGEGVRPVGKRTDWYRSRSTTRLNTHETTSSSCSTLSDEDSTPHVSRSNSYGRSEETTTTSFVNRLSSDEANVIYLHDDHRNNMVLRRTNTTTTPSSTTFNGNCDTPPGYEETISRQRLLKHYNRSNSFVITTTTLSSPMMKEREDGPPPLPPKTERPPLPPKQRLRAVDTENTYANSAELRSTYQQASGEFVYPSYSAPAAGTRIHVTSSPMTSSPVKKKPSLPPKETTTPSKKRSVTKTRLNSSVSTQTKQMKNAETQTDEQDFYLMYEDEWNSDDEDEGDFSEGNRSISPEYYPSFRTKEDFMAANLGTPSSTGAVFERPVSAQPSADLRQAGRRRIEPMDGEGGYNVDPIIHGEINWSVSQLRTLFNQGQQQQHDRSASPFHYGGQGGAAAAAERRHMFMRQNKFRAEVGVDPDSDQESYV